MMFELLLDVVDPFLDLRDTNAQFAIALWPSKLVVSPKSRFSVGLFAAPVNRVILGPAADPGMRMSTSFRAPYSQSGKAPQPPLTISEISFGPSGDPRGCRSASAATPAFLESTGWTRDCRPQ